MCRRHIDHVALPAGLQLLPGNQAVEHWDQEGRDELALRISELADFLSGKFTLARSEPKAAIKPGPIRSAKGKVVTVEVRDPKRV